MRNFMQRLMQPRGSTLRDVKGTDGKMYKLGADGKVYIADKSGTLRCVHRLGVDGVAVIATEVLPPKSAVPAAEPQHQQSTPSVPVPPQQ